MERPVGRTLVLVFFEDAGRGLVRRVHEGTCGLHQELMTLAELMQAIGVVALPPDPERTSAATEILLETYLQNLELMRCTCIVEPAAP